MKFIILTIAGIIFVAQCRTVVGNTPPTPTLNIPPFTETVPIATTIPDSISSADYAIEQLVSYSFATLNSIEEQLGSDHQLTIAAAAQVITNASNFEAAFAANISETFKNIVRDAFFSGGIQLDDKIDAAQEAISNIADALHTSNITYIFGRGLTDITNKDLATVGDNLSTEPQLTLIANAVTRLSQIDILNQLVDFITNIVSDALNKVAPIGFLDLMQNILDTTEADIMNTIPNACAEGENLSTVVIELTPTAVNDIITNLSNQVSTVTAIIDALRNTTAPVVLKTETSYVKIAIIVVESVLGAKAKIFTNIMSRVRNVEGALQSAIKSVLPLIKPYLTPAYNALVNEILITSQSVAENFLSCINTEITTLENYKSELEEFILRYQDGLEMNTIECTIIEETVEFMASVKLSLITTLFRVSICETIAAANTANVALPAFSKLVSLLD